MPVKTVKIRKILLGVVAAALAGAAGVPLAEAATTTQVGSCTVSLTTPFTTWSDANTYFLLPNGGFESGGTGWKGTGGVSAAADNEPWHVNGAGDTKSAALAAGSTLTTPSFCVNLQTPDLRFFVRNLGPASSALNVTINYTSSSGKQVSTLVTSVTGTSAWSVTPAVLFLSSIVSPLVQSGAVLVTFTFTPTGAGASWHVDDFYVDPLKHR